MILDSAAFSVRGPRYTKANYRFILTEGGVIDREFNSRWEAEDFAEEIKATGFYKL